MFPVLTIPSPRWGGGLWAPASVEMSPGDAWAVRAVRPACRDSGSWEEAWSTATGSVSPAVSVGDLASARLAAGHSSDLSCRPQAPVLLTCIPLPDGPVSSGKLPRVLQGLAAFQPLCSALAHTAPRVYAPPAHAGSPSLAWGGSPGLVTCVLRWVSWAAGSSSVTTSRPSLGSLLSLTLGPAFILSLPKHFLELFAQPFPGLLSARLYPCPTPPLPQH